MPVRKYAAGIAAAMLAAQPIAASDDFRERRTVETRSGAFAGFRVRVPLDEGRPHRPQARLHLTTTSNLREPGGATTTRYARGVELGAGRHGGVALTVAGRDVRQMEERLGVGGSTGTVLLVVGGVVLVVFVLAALADGPTAGPPEGAFD